MKYLRQLKEKRIITLMLVAFVAAVVGSGVSYHLSSNLSQSIVQSNCKDICVSLAAGGMTPNELAVKVGQFVQFNAADGQHHNIAEGDGDDNHTGGHDENYHDHQGGFLSGDFGPDEAWRVQFKQAGTYTLHDHLSPNQNIVVVVYEENSDHTVR